jgi:sigma-E factor negative regulatory protein RseA
MVMPDSISRLMDGELEDEQIELVCGRLRRPDAIATWACYHVIGDTLRGAPPPIPGFADRFAARLATEPTVIAPGAQRSRPVPVAWAVAASVAAFAVVGWAAYATLDTSPTTIARAREAATVRAAQVRPPAVPADYLLAHREYSPTAPIEGIGPGLRTASATATAPEVRP